MQHCAVYQERFQLDLPVLSCIARAAAAAVPRRAAGDVRAYERVETEPGLDKFVGNAQGTPPKDCLSNCLQSQPAKTQQSPVCVPLLWMHACRLNCFCRLPVLHTAPVLASAAITASTSVQHQAVVQPALMHLLLPCRAADPCAGPLVGLGCSSRAGAAAQQDPNLPAGHRWPAKTAIRAAAGAARHSW